MADNGIGVRLGFDYSNLARKRLGDNGNIVATTTKLSPLPSRRSSPPMHHADFRVKRTQASKPQQARDQHRCPWGEASPATRDHPAWTVDSDPSDQKGPVANFPQGCRVVPQHV